MLLSLRENGLASLFREVRVFKEREILQYSSYLYCSTSPICIAIRLPLVSQYFWENLGDCGHRDVPHVGHASQVLIAQVSMCFEDYPPGFSIMTSIFRPALSGGMDWWRMEWPFSRVRKIFFRGRNLQENPWNSRRKSDFRQISGSEI